VKPAWIAAAAGTVLAAGAVAYSAVEHVPVSTSLYWAVETGTTVGYGDITPRTSAGRLVALLVMLTAIPLMGALFAAVTSAHLARHHHLDELRSTVEKAHRIAADTYRHHTGQDHPDAP